MAELKYLADHLKPEECRRLVAALHFTSYNQPNNLDAIEGKVSEDIPCLNLLLHWNSLEGEGKGETHEMLFRRLRQIGRDDLAEWLGRTVFHELGQDLKRALDDPFQEFINENSTSSNTLITTKPVNEDNKFAWESFDTICWIVILGLIITTSVLLTRLLIYNCKRTQTEKKNRYGKYEKMESQVTNSETESEERFDVRRKDDPALTLMGV